MKPVSRSLSFQAGDTGGEVEAILNRPRGAAWLLVLAHGAGAGMRHPFMETISDRLAARGVATFRYQFPYMQKGGKRPDRPAVLTDTVRTAVAAACRVAKGLPLLAGGKSMGGRMTSTAASEPAARPAQGRRRRGSRGCRSRKNRTREAGLRTLPGIFEGNSRLCHRAC